MAARTAGVSAMQVDGRTAALLRQQRDRGDHVAANKVDMDASSGDVIVDVGNWPRPG
jgi:hypothetical protein